MSKEYDEYLRSHIANVTVALKWIADNLTDSNWFHDTDISEALEFVNLHDRSKGTKEEYDPYDVYFYGNNRSYSVVSAFDYAWLLHQNRNQHHWQYWVLIKDDDNNGQTQLKPLQIPLPYVLEMIADWWSFSWKSGNLEEIFDWYDKHRKSMLLHDKTRKNVEGILKEIWDILQEQKKDVEHSGVAGQRWGVRNGPPYPLDVSKTAEKLHEDAVKKNNYISKDVKIAAKESGGTLHGLVYQTKTEESIKRKLNKKMTEGNLTLSEAANSIKDASRYTVIANPDNFVKMYNDFKNSMETLGYKEVSCDNYFDKFKKGLVKHKAVQSNFADDEGYEFEVQFQTPESQKAKDDKIPIYNERRTVGISEERAKELEKQMEDLALKVSDPVGIETIISYDDHLEHSDTDEDKKFGVPEQKKFPMPDADHVRSAIRFFNYVDPKYEEELAKAILARMEEYGMSFDDFTVGDENRFKNYIPKKDLEDNDGNN